MGAAQDYHRMALECLDLAETAPVPGRQDALIRMAERWARLADAAEETPWPPRDSEQGDAPA